MVGRSNATTGWRAFLWASGTGMTDLGDLPGGLDRSYANGINNAGQVVGFSYAATSERAFLWQSGTMTDLGDLPGGSDYSEALGINYAGQVVGQSAATTGYRAFLRESGSGMQDLNALIDPSDPLSGLFTLIEARAINTSGQIVGYGSIGGTTHAFLASPVPVPPALWLLGSALAGLVGLNRRRAQG